MPYVPRFKNDVFISYAHASDQPEAGRDKGWVTELQEELEKHLTGRMSPAPKIYIDHSDLRKAGNYSQDLVDEISSSALLVTINCEPYKNSDDCTWELEQFRKKFGHDPRTINGGRRIVEIYKSLLPSGACHIIQPGNNGFWFCGNPDRGEKVDTFRYGTTEYWNALEVLEKEIKNLLFSMLKEHQCIFIGQPIDAIDPAEQKSAVGSLYRKLKCELQREYHVIASRVADEMAKSRLSVYFLSKRYDQPTLDLISKARDSGRPVLVIHEIDVDEDPYDLASRYLASLNESLEKKIAGNSPARLQLFRWKLDKQVSDLVGLVKELLREEDPPNPGPLVYLICDPNEIKDEEGRKVYEHVKNSPMKVEVSLFEENLKAHWKNIAKCDGIVLLWGSTGKEWFEEYQNDIKRAAGYREGRSVDSKSLLLEPNDEEKISIAKKMVPPNDLWDRFDPSKIDDFLNSICKRAYSARA